MKAPLSFGLIVAVTGALACSDSGDGVRRDGNGGSGAVTGNTGGTSSGGTAGTSSGGTAGAGTGGSAGTGSTGANYGPALVINADGTVKDELGNTGINGAALVVASSMNPEAVADFRDGALCMHGSTAAGFTDYGLYWGAQINLDLNRVANPEAGDAGTPAAGDAGPGDAGAGDAGGGEVLGQVAQAWDPRPVNVVGFSFKIDGPTVAPVLSVSAAPTGRDPSADPFCYRGASPVAGQTIDVLFTDVRLACWNAPPITASVFQDPSGYTTLNNLGWQINAGPDLAYMFDFCVSEIKPILGTP